MSSVPSVEEELRSLCQGLPINPIPEKQERNLNAPHAPKRRVPLSQAEKKLALANALRYFPSSLHARLAKEFSEELEDYGHIYMYRWVPTIVMQAYPISLYPAETIEGAAMMLMIMNNLDHRVAQYPYELVTYGGNGQVFSNWAQFWITMHYLSKMTSSQTLSMYSGHPLGLFPSKKDGPRAVITNGMVIPNYSDCYDKMFALGVSQYSQMTAGSWCYIGPQGIVHGTTLTILNAGRRYFGSGDLSGKVYLSSGLGGMSGAQAKAAVIAGCIGVIAEVDSKAIEKRHSQGWVMEVETNLNSLINRIRKCRKEKSRGVSIAFQGNIVTVWESLAAVFQETGELLVDLASDQTSCHAVSSGGYTPVGLTFEEARNMVSDAPEKFASFVRQSLRRQVNAINLLAKTKKMFFWDYGNAFLLEADRAGADIKNGNEFIYPSYVQHFMGDIFARGFGPYRWICSSCDPEDLALTDEIAVLTLNELAFSESDPARKAQYEDNITWIKAAIVNKLVVGSQARILYSDEVGRVLLAKKMNEAVRTGQLKASVILSRDHHDVSGTDSPYRETSDIKDGSSFCADMATQNFCGDAFRGASWVSLHNGGGVGWGEVINGGFGLVLDGSEEADMRAATMLSWDVLNGVSRRSWSGNIIAKDTIERAMKLNSELNVTVPNFVNPSAIENIFSN